MSVFLIIIWGIPVLSLTWWIWADRRLRKMNAGRGMRACLLVAILILLGGFTWVILSRQGTVTMPIPTTVYALVLLWGLIFLPFVGFPTMVGWSLWSIFRGLSRLRTGKNESVENFDNRKWTRREWLGATATVLPALGTFSTMALSLPMISRFRVREMTVSLKNLPPALDGMRIAHVTDTHVGKFTRGKVLDEIVAATNRLNADLVLFTGDLIDSSIRDLPAAVTMLQRMEAKSGVFIVEGNHDLFDDAVEFARGLRAAGLTLLRNEIAQVQVRGISLEILGIVWNRSEAKMAQDVDTVVALRNPNAFPILLAHHPHAFDQATKHSIPLTLAGHTHGGQLMLTNRVGAGSSMFRYWSGLYEKSGLAMVVSNGTGNWFPVRVNAPAEIIHLTLRCG
jgi:uncharacterized protein